MAPLAFDTVEITDLIGVTLATVNYSDTLEVTCALSNPREARISMPYRRNDDTDTPAEPACGELEFVGADGYTYGALGRMLRVYYRTHLVFWGVINEPDWDTSTGKVTIAAHDPMLRVKAAFARFGDDVVGPSGGPQPDNPLDYRTMRKLIVAAQNLATQAGYPDLGIKEDGFNDALYAGEGTGTVDTTIGDATVTGTGTSFLSDLDVGQLITVPADGSGEVHEIDSITDDTHLETTTVWATTQSGESWAAPTTIKIERGTNCFDELQRVSESRYGAEWVLLPRDDLGLTPLGLTSYYGELRTYEKRGDDLSGELVFRYVVPTPGVVVNEPNNCRRIRKTPGGTRTRNNVMAIVPGDTDETGQRAFGHILDSWSEIGIYSDWQNPQGGNSGDLTPRALEDFAHDMGKAYARPPMFLEVELLTEPADGEPIPLSTGGELDVPRYIRDFVEGDEARVIVDDGYFQLDATCRIMSVKITKADQSGNIKTFLEVVPTVAEDVDVATGIDEGI